MSSKMTKILMGASLFALMPATQAFAAGTAAGTDVTNTFTLTYQVGGSTTTQTLPPDADDTVTFTVDRVVDLTVSTSTPTVTAAPGQTGVVQTFLVVNDGNGNQAYDLDLFQQTSPTDDFDTTTIAVTIDIDADGDGTFETTGVAYTPNAGGVVSTPDIGPDGQIRVNVTSTVPPGESDANEATIALEANTLEPAAGGVGGTAGDEVVASTGTNGQNTVETVLADGAGTTGVAGVTDGANDGDGSAASTIVVNAAAITAAKTAALISADGSNCSNFAATPVAEASATYIPGSCVEYRITVSNAGTAAATAIAINDTLDTNLTFVAADPSGLSGNFTGTGGSVPASNADCGAVTCDVNLVDGSLAAGSVATPTTGDLVIRVLVK